ncbi:50S ribosome-binding GTPase [Halobacteriovorax sp. GB3]|uniref:ribosome biogenesis GTPase Der n=1 Tax=Halobacteriovorax sp. GB3 TaxID=2719615 RepID=UPI0023608635|nr:GTPase [Halobacteriovorax sp. GB3]MDD0853260.1 50S ribosome-binding GTPase [Halobacteriovorax sp. GB3]
MSKRSMVISLIGRPNVGKSSLFNRLLKKQHKAITHDMPGVTRDRHYGIAKFDDLANEQECETILVDTGGFYPQKIEEKRSDSSISNDDMYADKFFNIMTEHAEMAIQESDLVLFVVDVREGVLPFDEQIARYIRTQRKDFWLIVNKFDSDKQWGDEVDFYSLGLDPENMFMVSSAHGLGVQELRERIHGKLANYQTNNETLVSGHLQKGVTPREQVVSRVALIGAPNAGKSTLLNHLVGSKRALVSDIPGTTVDPIEGYFDLYFGKESKELNEDMNIFKQDGLLFKQYEDFRKNNPDVYESMINSYNREESADKSNGIRHLEDDMLLDGLVDNFEGEYDQFSEEDFSEEDVYVDDDFSSAESDDENLDRLYSQVFESDESEQDEQQDEQDEQQDSESQQLDEEIDEGSFWRSLHVVDTAGIRRQKSVKGFIEEQSVYRSLRCITESDIVIYMIDATKGMGHQDRRLLDIALEKGKSVIVCLNKIDLLGDELKDEKAKREWLKDLRRDVPWLYFCDLIPISAKYGKRVKQLRNAMKKTVLIRKRQIPTSALNRYIFDLIERHPIVTKGAKGKRFKVKYTSMVKTSPPTFLFFTNKSQGIPDSYRRYLKNGLRDAFEFDNTPIHLIFRTGNDLAKRMKKSKLAKEINFD